MNYETLNEILEQVEGSGKFSIDTITDVKLKGGKKNPFQGRVQKRTNNAVVTIYNKYDQGAYVNLVKEQMEKEGKDSSTFEVKPRAWGVRIENTPFVKHNEKHYIECFFESSGETQYLVDGEEYDGEIEGMPEKKVNEESQGGIENKVIVRTFSIDSLEKVNMIT